MTIHVLKLSFLFLFSFCCSSILHLVVTNKGNHLLITLCLVCSTIMVKFYEKLWLLKKITNYWHLNFLLLIAPKRGWHLCLCDMTTIFLFTKKFYLTSLSEILTLWSLEGIKSFDCFGDSSLTCCQPRGLKMAKTGWIAVVVSSCSQVLALYYHIVKLRHVLRRWRTSRMK